MFREQKSRIPWEGLTVGAVNLSLLFIFNMEETCMHVYILSVDIEEDTIILDKHSTYPTDIMYEPRHDKTNNVAVRPAKTQISLGFRPA